MAGLQRRRARTWAAALCVGACSILADTGAFAADGKAVQPTTGIWPDIASPVDNTPDGSGDAAVIVGIDAYDDLSHVTGAAENARDWEKWFLFGRHLPISNVSLLVDAQATIENITQKVEDATTKVGENGTLWFIFIGHGAPAKSGKDGVLIGADARGNEMSLFARSLPQESLTKVLERGKQAHTMVLLDACFNGRDAAGGTLLKNTQATPPVGLVPPSKATILTSSRVDEFSGALPGGLRPAFSYLMLGAMRGWGDANKDGAVTTDEAVGYAALALRTLPNNHEQHPAYVGPDKDLPLAKGGAEPSPDLFDMRRKATAWKPPEPPKGPELLVDLRCRTPMRLSSTSGLSVAIDRVQALPARVEEDAQHKVLRVAYAIGTGSHLVHLSAPGCVSREETITIPERGKSGVMLSGTLEPDHGLTDAVPFGDPDGWNVHASIGPELTFGAADFELFRVNSESAGGTFMSSRVTSLRSNATTVVRVGPGLTSRFLWTALQVEAGGGAWDAVTSGYAVTTTTTHAAFATYGPRVDVGIRVPMGRFAWNTYALTGFRFYNGKNGVEGLATTSGLFRLGGGMSFDAGLTCAFGVRAGFEALGTVGMLEAKDNPRVLVVPFLGAFLQPSRACSNERAAGPVGVRAEEIAQ